MASILRKISEIILTLKLNLTTNQRLQKWRILQKLCNLTHQEKSYQLDACCCDIHNRGKKGGA